MYILGIYLDPLTIYLSIFKKRANGLQLVENKEISLHEPHSTKKTRPPEEVLKEALVSFKGKIVSSLSSRDFFIRSFEEKHSKHIEETLRFQAEASCYFQSEDILTTFVLSPKKLGGLIFTVMKQGLKLHLSETQKWGIDPDIVSSPPSALFRFLEWKFPKLESCMAVHLGSEEITCAFIENRKLKKSYWIEGGKEPLLSAFSEDRKKILLKSEIEGAAKQTDLLLLNPSLNPRLSKILKTYKSKLEQVYFSYTKGMAIPIIFLGKGDTFLHLKEFLFESSKESFSLGKEEEKFGLSMGLALEGAKKNGVQLRREEFFPDKYWRKMGKWATGLMTLSLFLSGALIYFGHFTFKSQKQEMLQKITPHSFKTQNVQEKIDEWIDSVEANTKSFPYILKTPKVSHALAWLSSHPLLSFLKQEGDPIEIYEIKYHLEKGKKEELKAKITLEFSFENALNARKFHEVLIKGDEMVDPKLEISWDTFEDRYRACFYLKNGAFDVF